MYNLYFTWSLILVQSIGSVITSAMHAAVPALTNLTIKSCEGRTDSLGDSISNFWASCVDFVDMVAVFSTSCFVWLGAV